MKRYEKLSKEEIINAFTVKFENYSITHTACEKCILPVDNVRSCEEEYGLIKCELKIKYYLNKEIKTVPRCHKCKTSYEFRNMMIDFIESSKNDNDKMPSNIEISDYMMEEVEE